MISITQKWPRWGHFQTFTARGAPLIATAFRSGYRMTIVPLRNTDGVAMTRLADGDPHSRGASAIMVVIAVLRANLYADLGLSRGGHERRRAQQRRCRYESKRNPVHNISFRVQLYTQWVNKQYVPDGGELRKTPH
jgi:hypothetical protein